MCYTWIKLWKIIFLPLPMVIQMKKIARKKRRTYKTKYEIFMRFTIAICTGNWSWATQPCVVNTLFLLCVLSRREREYSRAVRALALTLGFLLWSCVCVCSRLLRCNVISEIAYVTLWHMCVTSGLKSNVIRFHVVDIKIEFDIFFLFLFLCFQHFSMSIRSLASRTMSWHTKLFHIWSLRGSSENCFFFGLMFNSEKRRSTTVTMMTTTMIKTKFSGVMRSAHTCVIKIMFEIKLLIVRVLLQLDCAKERHLANKSNQNSY